MKNISCKIRTIFRYLIELEMYWIVNLFEKAGSVEGGPILGL